MLRVFVPLTVAVVLASSFLCEQSSALPHVNHALVASALAVVFAVTVGAVVSRIAAALGGATDRAQTALRESRADLNRAQTVAGVGSWRMNVQRNELSWSDEVYRMFEIPPGTSLTYEDFLAAVHPETGVRGPQLNRSARGDRYDIEHRILVSETVKWVRERTNLSSTQKRSWAASAQCRTSLRVQQAQERERLLDDLAAARELLDVTVENTEAHLVYLDPEFNFVWVNDAYARACRRPKEEFYGRSHFDLFPHEENEAIFRRVRDTGEPARYVEKPFEFPDLPERGSPTGTGRCGEDSAGRWRGWCSLEDVTEPGAAAGATAGRRSARGSCSPPWMRISHRVKNNLTMVGGLLQLQAAGARDPVAGASGAVIRPRQPGKCT
jgi:PAS domain-containing protein